VYVIKSKENIFNYDVLLNKFCISFYIYFLEVYRIFFSSSKRSMLGIEDNWAIIIKSNEWIEMYICRERQLQKLKKQCANIISFDGHGQTVHLAHAVQKPPFLFRHPVLINTLRTFDELWLRFGGEGKEYKQKLHANYRRPTSKYTLHFILRKLEIIVVYKPTNCIIMLQCTVQQTFYEAWNTLYVMCGQLWL
jgi:hypothetical protein